MKICKLCNRKFNPTHFNQKLCSKECKYKAKRICQEKYKKSEKGKISNDIWVKSERRAENEKVYRAKPKARHLAVLRTKRYLEQHPEARERKKKRDNKFGKSDRGRKINRKATRKYRKTEKGKWQGKTYKYYLRNNHAGKIDKKAWEDKLNELNGECQICKTKEDITIDHIIPLSKGGGNNIENLQPLCRSCNCSKNNKI